MSKPHGSHGSRGLALKVLAHLMPRKRAERVLTSALVPQRAPAVGEVGVRSGPEHEDDDALVERVRLVH